MKGSKDLSMIPHVLVMVLGLCLSTFLTRQVQCKDVLTDKTANVMKGMDYLWDNSRHYIVICAQDPNGTMLDINNETSKHLNTLLKKLVFSNETAFSNITFKYSQNFDNITDIYLITSCCEEMHFWWVIITTQFACDKKLLTEQTYKVNKCETNLFKHFKRLKHFRVLKRFLSYSYHNLINQSSNLYPEKLLDAKRNFEIYHKFVEDSDEQSIKSILNNCCFGNSSSLIYCPYCSENLGKLAFLLKRKCRSTSHISFALHPLGIHRIKRDLAAQKETTHGKDVRPEREAPQAHTTMRYQEPGKQVWFLEFNETEHRIFLEKEELKRQLRREADWAYFCLVFLSILLLFSIWCLRGFHSRNTDKRLVTHSDRDHFLTVKEVIYQKAQYLPMFNKQGPLEEVFVHDCGTNTESSRLDMIDY